VGKVMRDVLIQGRANDPNESLDGNQSCATSCASDRDSGLGECLGNACKVPNEPRERQRVIVSSRLSNERSELTDLALDRERVGALGQSLGAESLQQCR
jgi:hypothetical protein